jgi:hypothetical protein
MSKTNNGGPAFPANFYDDKGHFIEATDGMTLRDYFAANAMQAIVGLDNCDDEDCAKQAYALADAMLKARQL